MTPSDDSTLKCHATAVLENAFRSHQIPVTNACAIAREFSASDNTKAEVQRTIINEKLYDKPFIYVLKREDGAIKIGCSTTNCGITRKKNYREKDVTWTYKGGFPCKNKNYEKMIQRLFKHKALKNQPEIFEGMTEAEVDGVLSMQCRKKWMTQEGIFEVNNYEFKPNELHCIKDGQIYLN